MSLRRSLKISPYTLPLTWMVLIFVVSGDLGSMDNTSSFLVSLIQIFFPEISSDALSGALFVIRKSGHLSEYAILAILWCRSLSGKEGTLVRYPLMMALLFSSAYAGLDEVHHAFVKSRTGSLADVGIDTLGAFMGIGIWKGFRRYRQYFNGASSEVTLLKS